MKLSIVMVTAGLPFHGDSLEEGSLGGSETAFLCMAKALAAQGHSVRAFCNCPKPGEYAGVIYAHVDQFESRTKSVPCDVLISSRWPEFLRMPGQAGYRVLWLHDTLVDANRFMGGLYEADLVLLLSEYHKENYKAQITEIDKFSWITKNGIDAEVVKANTSKKIPGKVIYTSRPERGLYILLADIMPLLLEKRPDIKLYFANYDLKGLQIPPEVEGKIRASLDLARQYPNNVFDLGHLSKDKLYKEISSAELLLYPTDFPEISCITAIEAQACGTPVVTTNDFALKETLGPDCGVLIEGSPHSIEYVQKFSESVLNLLEAQDSLKEMGVAGKEWIKSKGYSWDSIAASWTHEFQEKMKDRWKEKKVKIIAQLIRHGDIIPASLISDKEPGVLEDADYAHARFGVSEPTTEEVKIQYGNAVPRFKAMVEMLLVSQKAPKRILDVSPNYCSFGMMMPQAFKDAEVDICIPPGNVAEFLKATIKSLTLHTKTSVVEKPSGRYDAIIFGDNLELDKTPQDVLSRCGAYLTKDGCFLISSSTGPTHVLAEKAINRPPRLWNLDYNALRDIFQTSNLFRASYVQEGKNEANESYGHWITVASKPEAYGNVNLERKMYSTRPYESVSFCIITGEEEDNIGGMLKTVAKIADEILVIDTCKEGSTDRSGAIAETYGASVRKVEFNNFAQVRNESIRDAKGDWIFWIDTDERLVGAENVRKYTSGSVYNGFAVKQVHLTVDHMNKGYDIPVRLLRNKENYQFTGLIHEHCEDVSKGKFDNPISPRLLLPDVEIAHFGYLNESIRRKKCSSRNMALLQRATKEEPDRKLTWVLVIRDYLNILKWEVAEGKTSPFLTRGCREHLLLEGVVDTFLEHFPTPEAPFYALAYPMFQEALSVLGRAGLPYRDSPSPPFEVALAMVGGIGGVQTQSLVPQKTWFINAGEYVHFVHKNCARLVVGLGLAKREEFDELLESKESAVIYGAPPDAHEMLSTGVNAF